jgi:hypothetical protein
MMTPTTLASMLRGSAISSKCIRTVD